MWQELKKKLHVFVGYMNLQHKHADKNSNILRKVQMNGSDVRAFDLLGFKNYQNYVAS